MAGPVVILYVCNENQVLGIRFILSIAGYSVLIANSSHSALENLRRHHVDLILADQSLPRDRFEELLRNIKELKRDLPIALLVPSLRGRHARNGRADIVLAKEMDPQDLLAAIAQALAKLPAVRAI